MKKCLIVVDYQVDFVTGSLGFEGAKNLDNIIAEKIDEYHKNGDTVIFTLDTHQPDYLTTFEGVHLPVEHCIENADGHDIYGTVAHKRLPQDLCFNKPTFGSAKLFDYLRNNHFDSIELCGVVSNICVISNAVLAKTAQPETEIIVDSRAVASNDDLLNESALSVMKSLHIHVF